MMSALVCHLKHGLPLAVADGFPAPGCDLSGLGNLIGGSIVQAVETPCVVLYPGDTEKKLFRFDKSQGRFDYFLKLPETERSKVALWRFSLILAVVSKILRGEKIMLMHGCLLKDQNGDGIFLCGQSGMGKTTTANRWKKLGGSVSADDMILLEYGNETLYAHPLPTWSRCLESLQGEECDFEDAVALKTVLALSRDENREEIRDVEGFKYMTAVYSSCALFNIDLARKMQESRQKILTASIKDCAEQLYRRFPHRTLFANLQGDLKQTLKGI